jgi:MFS family permease
MAYGTALCGLAMMARLRLTFLMCLVQLLAMTGSLTFQALIPTFIIEWGLSNAEAAWIGGASYLGYALAAPTLVALTDRTDARRIVMMACLLGGVAGLGFAVTATGFWSAAAWRFATGVAIAGSYMPGLKALTDRLPDEQRDGRPQALYSATFSLASASSLFLAGLLTAGFGWSAAFAATGISALIASGLIAIIPPRFPAGTSDARKITTRIGAVLRNRSAMRFILAYAGHSWEMFAFRTWLVAFLTFASASGGSGGAVLISAIATVLVLAGLPAGVSGNELAERTERRRSIAGLMLAASIMAVITGIATEQCFVLIVVLTFIYGTLLMADNSAILVGTIQATPDDRRGAAIAIQTFLAALMALLSPLTVGIVLDGFGGTSLAWKLAFCVMALGPAVGAAALLWPIRRQ